LVILNILIQVLKIVFLLAFLVIIHEGGHFAVAKFFKIPVKEFSVGFGKKLLSKEKNGTTYSLRLFPLGGYVDIDDENKEGSFQNAPLYQKNLILLAGVTVNFIFAIIAAFFALYFQGIFVTNIVDSLKEGAPIVTSGIQVGDEIYKINGKRIYSKSQIDTAIYGNKGEDVSIVVKRNDELINYTVKPYEYTYVTVGFSVDDNNTVVNNNNSDIVAVGDKIIKINDIEVTNNQELEVELNKDIDDITKFEFNRNGEIITKEIKTEKFSKYYIGLMMKAADDSFGTKVYHSFVVTWDFVFENIRGIYRLLTGQNQNAELMGIIGVSEIVTQTEKGYQYLSILASVSMSLAIMNLLPLPILDGGKILLFTIERYRKKQFSEKFEKITTGITLSLLLILTVYVMISDVLRIIK